ncbi:UBP1-associated proteins 1C-like [Oryza brachyantha]|uniref:UBP1-associated proteins 1C-like n=1 Tax=Oryza brachyantha TaxID=4533 RepID=UPI001ADB1181|nr:UBP1-associated proteins 1C-like [Oryza brachyantha]
MELSGRGPAGGSRFAGNPPPHDAGDPMAVVRDALLSQLQHDRLRQEVIVAELAKIERAMALRNASPSPSPTPRYGAAAAAATETVPNKKPSASEKPEPAVQKPTPASAWSCNVCHVRTSSERNLRDHCGGQKHQAKVAELEKRAKAMAGQKAKPTARWSCSICQVSCTGEWDFDVHLKGQRHQASTQALLEQSKKNPGSSEKKTTTTTTTAPWICSVCQALCTCESDLHNHLKGKRHQLKVEALREAAAKQESSDPPKLAKQESSDPPKLPNKQRSEWFCSVCQARCNSASQLEDHCRSTRHQQKAESSDGSTSFTSASSEKTHEQSKALYFCEVCSVRCTSERMVSDHLGGKRHAKQEESLAFCEACKLQCNSEKMLAHHRAGRKHQAKLEEMLRGKA